MQPKISIIVPVYKAEKYIHKCIDSILAQTFANFEILLINDGSPDKSGKICDEYAKKDKRVKVFHKENGGVSLARQLGNDNATGEYTIHADPDDWIEPNMLEELYAKAVEDDADMVMCDYFTNYENKQQYCKSKPSKLEHNIVLKEMFLHLTCSCCNKLVRRSCYIEHGIKFDPELSYCEDLMFNTSLLLNKIRISYLPKAFYHYVQYANPNSIVHSVYKNYNEKEYEYDMMLLTKFQQKFHGTDAETVAQSRISYYALNNAFFGNYYDSKKFKQKLHHLLPLLKPQGCRKPHYYFYLLSCWGYYTLAYRLFFLLKSIKNGR